MFKKNGLPRHPERSIYYDASLNPFGVAPPGMPYMQRAKRADEVWSDDEEMEEGECHGSVLKSKTEYSQSRMTMLLCLKGLRQKRKRTAMMISPCQRAHLRVKKCP